MSYPTFPITTLESFTLPDYQLVVTEDVAGVEVRRSYLETGQGAKLSLIYEGLNATEVLEFIQFYKDYASIGRGFGIPQSLLEYPDIIFQSYLEVLSTTVLLFEEPPIIVGDISNIYSVNIRLRAVQVTLEAPENVFTILSSSVTLSVNSSIDFVVWEQISGQPTTIVSPNSLTTQVVSQGGVLTNQQGELVFKVSLLDNPLVFSLVRVVTIPTSFTVFDSLSSASTYLKEEETNFRVPLPLSWNFSAVSGTENTYYPIESFTQLNIYWSDPPDSTYVLKYRIEYWDNEWILQEEIEKSQDNSALVAPNQTFRIVSVLSFDGITEFSVPSLPLNISVNCANDSIAVANYLAPLSLEIVEISEQVLDFETSELNVESLSGYNLLSEIVEINNANTVDIPLTATEYAQDDIESTLNAQIYSISGLEMFVQDVDLDGAVIG